MKIITENSAFVQKNDLEFLTLSDSAVPASFYEHVYGGGVKVVDDYNKFDFVKFNRVADIEFIKSLDWIIDYDDVKDLDDADITKIVHLIMKEQTALASVYNVMSDEEKRKHSDIVRRCNYLEYKFYSLRDFLLFKKGFISMKLPAGVDYPKEMVRRKGVKRFFKKKNDGMF